MEKINENDVNRILDSLDIELKDITGIKGVWVFKLNEDPSELVARAVDAFTTGVNNLAEGSKFISIIIYKDTDLLLVPILPQEVKKEKERKEKREIIDG